MITAIEAILVFSFVTWVGVILLAWNKGYNDIQTGETICGILIFLTLVGFGLTWFVNFGI